MSAPKFLESPSCKTDVDLWALSFIFSYNFEIIYIDQQGQIFSHKPLFLKPPPSETTFFSISCSRFFSPNNRPCFHLPPFFLSFYPFPLLFPFLFSLIFLFSPGPYISLDNQIKTKTLNFFNNNNFYSSYNLVCIKNDFCSLIILCM